MYQMTIMYIPQTIKDAIQKKQRTRVMFRITKFQLAYP